MLETDTFVTPLLRLATDTPAGAAGDAADRDPPTYPRASPTTAPETSATHTPFNRPPPAGFLFMKRLSATP
jgi:hypothetical protein